MLIDGVSLFSCASLPDLIGLGRRKKHPTNEFVSLPDLVSSGHRRTSSSYASYLLECGLTSFVGKMGNSASVKPKTVARKLAVMEPCRQCGEDLHGGMRCEPMTGWIYGALCTTCVISSKRRLVSGTHRGHDALYIATSYPSYTADDCNPIEENLINYIRAIYKCNYDSDGEKKLTFGKYSNRVYSQITQGDPLYVDWCRKYDDPPVAMQLFLNYADLHRRKMDDD